MALPQILLIDDNEVRVGQFDTTLSFMDYQVLTTTSSDYLLSLDNLSELYAIFIGNGCEKLAALVKDVLDKVSPGLPVFLLIDRGGAAQVSTAVQKMVTQCLEWPSNYAVFSILLSQLPVPKKRGLITNKPMENKGLAGKSTKIIEIRELIAQVSGSDATVLVLGESGTGKEVVAQALHRSSNRKDKAFVPVNCGAIPGELLESELFGHEKGAFTGALTSREGRFEMAEGGTLFLDEIGDMPMPMQVKLLRVLQERSFERVGSNKTINCDVRVIAATHRNLENEIKEKRFREDLYYRLNVFPIELPSLRERTEDIPLLVSDLLVRMKAMQRDTVEFTKQALALMMQHPWPGNVRELSNFIERLAITHSNKKVDTVDLPEKFQDYEIPENMDVDDIVVNEPVINEENQVAEVLLGDKDSRIVTPAHLPEQGIDLKEYLNNLEINLIRQALDECNGIVAHAAKLLNMRRTTLVEKLRKYEIS